MFHQIEIVSIWIAMVRFEEVGQCFVNALNIEAKEQYYAMKMVEEWMLPENRKTASLRVQRRV